MIPPHSLLLDIYSSFQIKKKPKILNLNTHDYRQQRVVKLNTLSMFSLQVSLIPYGYKKAG